MAKIAATLLQLSDLHILPDSNDTLLGVRTEHYFEQVLNSALAKKSHYDLLLLSGDLAQSPCVESYQRILDKLSNLLFPSVCLAGNHDNFDLMQKLFNSPKNHCQRRTVLKNWQLICLNSQIIGSEKGHLAKSELTLLKNYLESYPDFHTIIATHHHCLPTESAWLDTMQIDNSHEFLNLVKHYPHVKAITTGHIHQILEKKFAGIEIFGTPSTCFQFKTYSHDFALEQLAPAFRTFDLFEDGKISTKVKRLDLTLDELNIETKGY